MHRKETGKQVVGRGKSCGGAAFVACCGARWVGQRIKLRMTKAEWIGSRVQETVGGLDRWFGFGVEPLVLEGRWEATPEHLQTANPNHKCSGKLKIWGICLVRLVFHGLISINVIYVGGCLQQGSESDQASDSGGFGRLKLVLRR